MKAATKGGNIFPASAKLILEKDLNLSLKTGSSQVNSPAQC